MRNSSEAKRLLAGCFLLLVAGCFPLCADDNVLVVVERSVAEEGTVSVEFKLDGKDHQLTCFRRGSSCVAPAKGEYVMVIAGSGESVYEDCTNVVLYKKSGETKDRVGVYCWLTSEECYIVTCTTQQVETVPSEIPSKVQTKGPGTAPSKVPDAETAIRIAERILIETYGKKQIDQERPLKATLSNGVWLVRGTLNCHDAKGNLTPGWCVGGTAAASIRQNDGRILRVTHTK